MHWQLTRRPLQRQPPLKLDSRKNQVPKKEEEEGSDHDLPRKEKERRMVRDSLPSSLFPSYVKSVVLCCGKGGGRDMSEAARKVLMYTYESFSQVLGAKKWHRS